MRGPGRQADPVPDHLGLRDRKRLDAMRRIQAVALDLIASRSFDEVTVEEVADASEVSPSSVYRYFGTKEGVFLWDEYDEPAFEELERNLTTMAPLEALRAAIESTLAARVEPDEQRLLRQLDVIYREPALTNAMAQQTDEFRHSTSLMLATAAGRKRPSLEDQVAAGAMIGALTAAIEEFVRLRGRRSLTTLFDDAIAVLARGLTLS